MDGWLISIQTVLMTHAIPFAYRLLGAIALWIAGAFGIRMVRRVIHLALERRNLDATLARYVESTLDLSLKLLLLLTVFGVFGVETTSFAAVLAAVGIAIGAAWSGLLSNFAAGVFLITLKPFNVGDLIIAGGSMGFVQEVGLFVTKLHTESNVRVFIGNSRLLSETLQNLSVNPIVRVDLKVVLPHGIKPREAIRALDERIRKIPQVSQETPPQIGIFEFTLEGPLLVVRPFCEPKDYLTVFYETNLAIADTFEAAGYPVPEQRHVLRRAA
jgi:small conductance mechanosensitive channel